MDKVRAKAALAKLFNSGYSYVDALPEIQKTFGSGIMSFNECVMFYNQLKYQKCVDNACAAEELAKEVIMIGTETNAEPEDNSIRAMLKVPERPILEDIPRRFTLPETAESLTVRIGEKSLWLTRGTFVLGFIWESRKWCTLVNTAREFEKYQKEYTDFGHSILIQILRAEGSKVKRIIVNPEAEQDYQSGLIRFVHLLNEFKAAIPNTVSIYAILSTDDYNRLAEFIHFQNDRVGWNPFKEHDERRKHFNVFVQLMF